MNGQPSFSLLDKPWIRVETTENGEAVLGIRDVFDGRHSVRRIRGESPAQDYAVLRVLLAIFWRAHVGDLRKSPGKNMRYTDWASRQLKAADKPDEKVLDYLERHAARFDLLDPAVPFMQVADLASDSGAYKAVYEIVPEAQSAFFTMRGGRDEPVLDFAEAARWIIYAQAFDYSGIKTGAIGDSRVKGGKGYPIGTGWTGMTGGTVVVGDTLRETLVLNSPKDVISKVDDLPSWEREADTAAERVPAVPVGAADLATWQARRIRLHHDGHVAIGVVVSNGDRIPDAGANVRLDPMTPYRYSKNKSKKGHPVFYPRPYEAWRMMWKSLEPLIALQRDPGFDDKNVAPLRPENLSQLTELREAEIIPAVIGIHLVSVGYGPQSSSVASTVEANLELPVELLAESAGRERRLVIDCATATHDAAVSLGTFAGMLAQAAGGMYEFKPAPTESLLAELEPDFKRWIAGVQTTDLDKHVAQWNQRTRRIIGDHAAVLLRGAGPKALVGRNVSGVGSDSGSTLVSAGTAYRWLQRRLHKLLPLPEDTTTPTQDPEGKS